LLFPAEVNLSSAAQMATAIALETADACALPELLKSSGQGKPLLWSEKFCNFRQ